MYSPYPSSDPAAIAHYMGPRFGPMPHMGMHPFGQPMFSMNYSTPIPRQRTPNNNTPSRTVAAGTQWSHQTTMGSQSKAVVGFPYTSDIATPMHMKSQVGAMSAATAATTTAMTEKCNPITGRGLERDLNLASKEELLQILLDLSSCNNDAANFIHTKAQLFALRVNCCISHSEFDDNSTPSKPLFQNETPMMGLQSRSNSGKVLAKESPARDLQQCLHERHTTPESRAFATEAHPCLRLYGACRHTTNCIFKTLPRNLCLNWVRGSCAGGSDCGMVHRFPPNCPAQVEMIFELSHGGNRTEIAKRAETLSKPCGTPLPSGRFQDTCDLNSTTPTNETQRTAQRLVFDSSEEDTPTTTPKDTNSAVSFSETTRCLNDSFDNAASS